MGDREDKNPGGGGSGEPKQIEPPSSNPAQAPQNQGGQSSGSQEPKSAIAAFFLKKTNRRGNANPRAAPSAGPQPAARAAPSAWPQPAARAAPSAGPQPAARAAPSAGPQPAARAAPSAGPQPAARAAPSAPPPARKQLVAFSAWKQLPTGQAEPSTSAGPSPGEPSTSAGPSAGAGAGRDLEADFGSRRRENPEPEEDRSQAGTRFQSSVANFAIVNLPQQQARQGAAGVQHRRGQEENQQWASLIKRGGMYMEDVSREELENWAVYSPGYFDAIFPILQVDEYPKFMWLLTNHFQIERFVDQSWTYKIEWDPSHVGTIKGLSEWRMKAFEAMNELVYETWTGQGIETDRETALGCWDRGPELLRLKKLDPDAAISFKGVKGYLPMREKTNYNRRFNIRMKFIHHQPQKTGGPLNPVSVQWADYANFKRTGGAWSQLTHLFNALQNVLGAYPTRNHYLEDWRKKKHYFHAGFPRRNDPEAAYVEVRNFGLAVDRFCTLRRGFRMATKILQGGIYVNMITSINMFWGRNHNLYDVMLAVAQLCGFNAVDLKCVKHLESNLKYVQAKCSLSNLLPENLEKYPVKYYKVYGFSRVPASDLVVAKYERTFGGKFPKRTYDMNFFDFLEIFYGVNQFDRSRVDPKYANVPAVKVHPRYEFYLPPWLLTCKDGDKFPTAGKTKLGTLMHGRLQDIHKEELVKDRFKRIKQQLRERLDADPWLKMFGLVIDPNFHRVKGYRMPPPELFVANAATNALERAGEVRDNGWCLLNNQRLLSPAEGLGDFIVFTVEPITRKVAVNLMRAIHRTLQQNRIVVHGNFNQLADSITNLGFFKVENINDFATRLQEELNAYVTRRGCAPRLVYCVVYDKSRLYHAFKYILDFLMGIPSQWLVVHGMRDFNAQGRLDDLTFGVTEYGKRKLNNLVLKLNRKLGGKNVHLRSKWLSDTEEAALPGTMIFGSDVTHPTHEQPHSIASVVATNDMPPRTFGARCRVQEGYEEMIYDLEDMVCDLVRVFKQRNPQTDLEHLIFFRDGVSNEIYRDVLLQEVPRIYNGVQRGGGGNRVKLLLVLGMKRHHTRFMVAATNKCIDHGTAINDLNLPHQQNFYMSSHQAQWSHAKMGISRPVCYQVIVDQIGLTLNELQTMIYHSSFTYDKTYRSLFTAPASHYSHMACTRAKCYYLRIRSKPEDQRPPFPAEKRTRESRPYAPHVKSDLTPHINIRDTMFYL
ncbi:protein MpPIWIb [Marchantia polymorpha subsp. ruderalis]|uniref:Piwi domain-containing protein n=3 Tax=Marchantia polymorpha TaxID=3197 RepID=A0AAF6AYC9_MARPO|nr:hypothetical protein MARPO_0006s0218 [Marchantia polymorpha]BBN04763.1 hypothetical protein Mp_3g07440 [Marchantia polymorpha subsp. ruderalis]|eukprot:PTQ48208.1 hypothetical protein MARPO_0006s0218 [Marchantia polymorpha]